MKMGIKIHGSAQALINKPQRRRKAQGAVKACMLLILLTVSAFPIWRIPAFAVAYAADKAYGTLGIRAAYSDGITPQDGDTFEISFVDSDTYETREITVDASKITSSFGNYEVSPGTYTIFSLAYTGKNRDIESQGYGLERTFRVSEGGDCILHLCIGSEEVSSLEVSYGDPFVIDAQHDGNGEWTVYNDGHGTYTYGINDDGTSYIEYLETSDTAADDAEDSGGESWIGEVTDRQQEQEPVTIYYDGTDKEGEKQTGFNCLLLIPLAVFLGAGALYITHRGKE